MKFMGKKKVKVLEFWIKLEEKRKVENFLVKCQKVDFWIFGGYMGSQKGFITSNYCLLGGQGKGKNL